MAPKKIIAFDLYGTLLSTESVADDLSMIYGNKAKSIAAQWRTLQLEYTWRINSMGEYKSFSEITRSALGHAVADHGLTLQPQDAHNLMRSYDTLHAFPEIPVALDLLQKHKDAIDAYIFTNGTSEMVENSIKTSLGPSADIFRSVISVDAVQCFKPDPRTYSHLLDRVGKKGHPEDVWLMSCNPFDVLGAKSSRLKAAFIDRTGKGWIDRLDEMQPPSIVAKSVEEAIQAILDY
ncbi:haloacid dehalogenase [Xylariaceae sp. FL1019]|nr:haloacid dehalogenase [Xylariaceae sp. FL1019]